MWNEIIDLAMKNGIWAVLFCFLFLYELKDSRRREHKYQDTVSKLTSHLELIRDIDQASIELKTATTDIKSSCQKLGDDVHEVYDGISALKSDIDKISTACEQLSEETSDIRADIRQLESDAGEIRTDIRQVKTDAGEIRGDIRQVKTDAGEIRTDIRQVKTDTSLIKDCYEYIRIFKQQRVLST